jgi:hypothetical protein
MPWQTRSTVIKGLLDLPSASDEARIAYTEDFFRRINRAHAKGALNGQPRADFRCECWHERCTADVSLAANDWALVRAQGNRFAVAPDHVAQRFEAVLTTHPTFWLIEKFGKAGEIAEELARLEHVALAAGRR